MPFFFRFEHISSLLTVFEETRNPRFGIREEKGKLHHPNSMDLHNDIRFLCCNVYGTHLYHNSSHRRSDSVFQGSNRHFQPP